MIPVRERLVQLARLIGPHEFRARFGAPQSAEPPPAELAALVGERIGEIARGLVEEAAASDDVIDAESARAYLEDRLRQFEDLLPSHHVGAIRVAFVEATKDW